MPITVQVCKRILKMDGSIRFAGVANGFGRIVASEYRKGITPLLTLQESEMSVVASVIRQEMRKVHEAKLGKTLYAVAAYEKVKRATIPMTKGSVLMVSFDILADHESIILHKLLPFLKAHQLLEADIDPYRPLMVSEKVPQGSAQADRGSSKSRRP